MGGTPARSSRHGRGPRILAAAGGRHLGRDQHPALHVEPRGHAHPHGRWEPSRALMLIEQERCTVFNAVDMMRSRCSSIPTSTATITRPSARAPSPRWAGAATGCSTSGRRLGVTLAYQPYGMTEVNALALVHELDEPLRCGRSPQSMPPGLEAGSCTRQRAAPCAVNEEGGTKSGGPLVTRGYYKKPEETAAAFTEDGWFRTGTRRAGRQGPHGLQGAGSRDTPHQSTSWSRRARSRPILDSIPPSSRPSWSAYPTLARTRRRWRTSSPARPAQSKSEPAGVLSGQDRVLQDSPRREASWHGRPAHPGPSRGQGAAREAARARAA